MIFSEVNWRQLCGVSFFDKISEMREVVAEDVKYGQRYGNY